MGKRAAKPDPLAPQVRQQPLSDRVNPPFLLAQVRGVGAAEGEGTGPAAG
jgi:hypothetical protein